MITALGGGVIRDTFIDSLPPATFSDWRYLAVAASGSLVAFTLGRHLDRLTTPILVFDAAGLSLFAVSGALKGLNFDVGLVQAVILGAITAVGGGTMRDVLIGRIPVVLRSELYAIPALAGALVGVIAEQPGVPNIPAAPVPSTLDGCRESEKAPASPQTVQVVAWFLSARAHSFSWGQESRSEPLVVEIAAQSWLAGASSEPRWSFSIADQGLSVPSPRAQRSSAW